MKKAATTVEWGLWLVVGIIISMAVLFLFWLIHDKLSAQAGVQITSVTGLALFRGRKKGLDTTLLLAILSILVVAGMLFATYGIFDQNGQKLFTNVISGIGNALGSAITGVFR